MLKMLGLATALLVAGITTAAAQYGGPRPSGPPPGWSAPPPPPAPVWRKGDHPYAQRHHRVCHEKAWRLRHYERFAASDGRISGRERREIEVLRRDLDSTCGRWRWRG